MTNDKRPTTTMIHNFRDLDVWKRSMSLAERVYAVTRKYPEEEKFGLISQTQRAVVSIASNIAEGAGRGSDKDFAYFLNVALGSAFEVETQLMLARQFKYITEEEQEMVLSELHIIQPQLNALIKKYSI